MNDDFMNNSQNFEFEDPSKKGPTGDQLQEALQEAGVIIPDNSMREITINNYLKNDGTIDQELIYNELARLISEGNVVVKNLKYVDPNAEGTLSGMASVLSAVRQMIADFVKIHSDYIKHKQKMELEQFKEASRLRLMEKKYELDMKKLKFAKSEVNEESDGTKTFGITQQGLLEMIREEHSKEIK